MRLGWTRLWWNCTARAPYAVMPAEMITRMLDRIIITCAAPLRLRASACCASAWRMQTYRKSLILHGLGILALTLQLVLAFGHNHFDRGDATAHVAAYADCDAGASMSCPVPDHDNGDDDCPVCQAMALVASAVVPAPPAVSIPFEQTASLRPLPSVEFSSHQPVSNFDARGPPTTSHA